MSPSGGRRGLAAKLALAGLALLASVALLEVGLRVVARDGGGEQTHETDVCDGLPVLTRSRQLYEPQALGCYRGAVHRTNGHGTRGGPLAPNPNFRILVVGDSVTMGSGVAEDATYAARLQDSLNAATPLRRVEVINAGVAGFNIEEVARRAEQLAPRLSPQLLVYGYTLNDLEGEAYMKSAGAWGELRGSSSALVRFVGPRLHELAELVWPPRGSYVRELSENYEHNPRALARLQAGLARIAAVGRRESACVVVFIHTYLFHLNRWHPMQRFYDVVAEQASELGLHPVESLGSVMGGSRDELWVSPVDTHPSIVGHARFAEALEAGIRALPSACNTGL